MNSSNPKKPKKFCKTCVLPDTFPGIHFHEDGRCSFCTRYKGAPSRLKEQERYKLKFLSILEAVKGKGPYDALVAYSGGKDSSYTLRLLKEEFGMKILAVTFDHGFVSPTAHRNIATVTGALDVDRFSFTLGEKTLNEIFIKSINPTIYSIKALERASSICNSCMTLVKSFMVKAAVEMNVPLLAYGWSPCQAPIQSSVFKSNATMIRQMQTAMTAPLKKMVGDRLSGFLLSDRHFERQENSSPTRFPVFVHPLAFFDYNEDHIVENIRQLGWQNPKDTDTNSTNCLLNGFAIEMHMQHFGFHPYAFETAWLVREGYMTREEGLKKLAIPPDPKVIKLVKQRLGVDDSVLSTKV